MYCVKNLVRVICQRFQKSGMEVALYGEEILVFGDEAIKDIFAYAKDINEREAEKHGHLKSYNQKLSL